MKDLIYKSMQTRNNMKINTESKRILVWGLTNNKAGTEAVIKNYVLLSKGIVFDFLCYEEPTSYRMLFDNTKNKYFLFPKKSENPIYYYNKLHSFMKHCSKEYDALWMNINDAANVDAIIWAKRYGISKRIIHVHNSQVANMPMIKIFSFLNKQRCLNAATDYWACSELAGKNFFHGQSFTVIPNPVNPKNSLYSDKGRKKIRAAYEIHEEDFVVGAVGRLSYVKNISFLISLFPNLFRINPNMKLLLVGDGDLRPVLEQQVKQEGISGKVIFAGSQDDIADYLSAFDLYVMPSLFEGLPVSLLEAQFNGLPCVVSDAISSEAIISKNVLRVPLEKVDKWINAIQNMTNRNNQLISNKASRYTLENCKKLVQKMF